jgi:hypothetical protein
MAPGIDDMNICDETDWWDVYKHWKRSVIDRFYEAYPDYYKPDITIEVSEEGTVYVHCQSAYPLIFKGFAEPWTKGL